MGNLKQNFKARVKLLAEHEKEIYMIFVYKARGESFRKIGRRFGVSPQAIQQRYKMYSDFYLKGGENNNGKEN